MSQAGKDPGTFDQSMRSELDRRITEFACYSDGVFGPLDARDLVATLVFFIALPLFAVWISR